MAKVTVAILNGVNDSLYVHCSAIRRVVFQVGQQVPVSREVDGLDPESVHFLALLDDTPVGTARYRVKDGWAKAERVAVLEHNQGAGLGRALMSAIESHARQQGLAGVLLSSQEDAVVFYKKLHYRVVGEAYYDANILHRDMRKPF